MRETTVKTGGEAARKEDVQTFDVHTMQAGETLVVETDTGTTWYITATRQKFKAGDYVVGFSIFSDSRRDLQVVRHPKKVGISRHLRKGEKIEFRQGGRTANVKRVTLEAKVVIS